MYKNGSGLYIGTCGVVEYRTSENVTSAYCESNVLMCAMNILNVAIVTVLLKYVGLALF